MTDKETTVDQKVKRYHSEEIKLILFICAADLSSYEKEDLICFTEDIEGRIEVLFSPNCLASLDDYFRITPDIEHDFQCLKDFLTSLYSSNWHKKMQDREIWSTANILSSDLLRKLNINCIEPNHYKETHLKVDWT